MAYGSFDMCRGNGIQAKAQLGKMQKPGEQQPNPPGKQKGNFRTKRMKRRQTRGGRRQDIYRYVFAVWQQSVTTFRQVAADTGGLV
eukprot:scaffold185923_cov31-Prasinocladus_malaysianus.AAC.1